MTDKKISELTSITGADVSDANDVLPIVDTSVATTKKITREELFKSVSSVDINGGTIDGTVIGGSTPASISGTTITATGDVDISDKIVHTGDTNTAIRFPAADTVTVETAGTERVRIDSSGNVGIGRPANYKLDAYLSGTGSPAIASSNDNVVTILQSVGSAQGNVGTLTSHPLALLAGNAERMRIDTSGNVTITGSLSKGSGSFKIDHPIKPETHHLVHSFIEGPQADNIYRGRAALTGGTATVNLDQAARMTEGTFVALNCNVQCFTTNEDGWTAVRGTVNGNILTIEAQDAACADTVSWLVIGERHDHHMIETNWTNDQGRVITEPAKEAST